MPARRRLFADITPLRESGDFRRLYAGQLVSFLGSQLAIVAVPFQVFDLTHSSFQVGLVSLAQLGPLLVGSLVGGAVADQMDRRRLILVMQVAQAATSVALALNVLHGDGTLWPIYVFTSLAAALSGIDRPARSAAVPGVVDRSQLAAAYALWQILLQVGAVAGPALAGILLARFGLAPLYWLDAVSFGAAFIAVRGMGPLPPAEGASTELRSSIFEGVRYARARQELVGVFVSDLDAMIFGMPRAVFPALAENVFGGGATTYGLLSAAPGAGALIGALTTGWVGSVRRQGLAVILAVAAWGLAITGFGFVRWLWVALLLLALAGAADVISAVFRNTILQTIVPDRLRGRLSALQIAVVSGGPRLGDAEAGAAAAIGGARFAVWTGGLGCLLGVGVVAVWLPRFRGFLAGTPEPEAGAQEAGTPT
ncbi:MAG TPA: MFS transporter [Acidimicrobiia bacterium]|nr:MFS transporter [Acidimicrobiia bacterium]